MRLRPSADQAHVLEMLGEAGLGREVARRPFFGPLVSMTAE